MTGTAHGTGRRQRGRPRATKGADTRSALVDAARRLFAEHGYDGTSLSAIATAADLTPTALYHYFDDKPSLYSVVASETIEIVWSGLLEAVERADDLAAAVEAFLGAADRFGLDRRFYSAFLIGLPVEARRQPEFAALLDALSTWYGRVFDSIAGTGIESGELGGFATRDRATDAIRSLLLGWSYETHYQPGLRATRADGVRAAVAAWTARS